MTDSACIFKMLDLFLCACLYQSNVVKGLRLIIIIVIDGVDHFPQAMCMLFAIYHLLNFSYPKELKSSPQFNNHLKTLPPAKIIVSI